MWIKFSHLHSTKGREPYGLFVLLVQLDFTIHLFQNSDVASSFYGPRKTVQRARSKIGKGGYNLLTHNCEHFAIYCKTGLEESTQTGLEGKAARFLRPKWGPLKWFVDDVWRVEAEY